MPGRVHRTKSKLPQQPIKKKQPALVGKLETAPAQEIMKQTGIIITATLQIVQ